MSMAPQPGTKRDPAAKQGILVWGETEPNARPLNRSSWVFLDLFSQSSGDPVQMFGGWTSGGKGVFLEPPKKHVDGIGGSLFTAKQFFLFFGSSGLPSSVAILSSPGLHFHHALPRASRAASRGTRIEEVRRQSDHGAREGLCAGRRRRRHGPSADVDAGYRGAVLGGHVSSIQEHRDFWTTFLFVCVLLSLSLSPLSLSL